MNGQMIRRIMGVCIFAIAMGFLETAVVVYLRELYYPDGFAFPLRLINADIALTELLREAATLIMLLGVAFFAGKNRIERFAFFIFAFAIWDIFYYVFLFLLLAWPSSLMTMDILFLIPVTWVGPVIAPVINSLMMILLACIILYFSGRQQKVRTRPLHWLLLIAGSLVVIAAYTEEYTRHMLAVYSVGSLLTNSSDPELLAYACSFIPRNFQWWIFAAGACMHLIATAHIWYINYFNKESFKR